MAGKRLLLVGPLPPPINGMSKAFQLLVDGLAMRGWQLDVLNTADQTWRRGGTFSFRRARHVAELIASAWRNQRNADGLYLAISQSRLGFLKDVAVMTPALVWGRPIVVHLHGGNFRTFYAAQPEVFKCVISRFLRRVHRIVVLSPEMRADFDMVPGWGKRTIAVPNATDLPLSEPRSAPSRRLRILYLSNLMVQKGYLDVLDGARLLGERNPNLEVTVDFAGAFKLGQDLFSNKHEMESDFKARLANLPPNVCARWHGVVDGTRKLALLDGADVFALPTYYVNEGQPISIIEAMARGLPVIATAHRGIRHMLPASQIGLLVEPRAPAEVAERLDMLARNPKVYERLSRDSLNRAKDFSFEAHVNAMSALLLRAVESRGSGPLR